MLLKQEKNGSQSTRQELCLEVFQYSNAVVTKQLGETNEEKQNILAQVLQNKNDWPFDLFHALTHPSSVDIVVAFLEIIEKELPDKALNKKRSLHLSTNLTPNIRSASNPNMFSESAPTQFPFG